MVRNESEISLKYQWFDQRIFIEIMFFLFIYQCCWNYRKYPYTWAIFNITMRGPLKYCKYLDRSGSRIISHPDPTLLFHNLWWRKPIIKLSLKHKYEQVSKEGLGQRKLKTENRIRIRINKNMRIRIGVKMTRCAGLARTCSTCYFNLIDLENY